MESSRRAQENHQRLSVAIVIASKNRQDDLLSCLGSILAQPTQPAEIIVVDQSTPKYILPSLPSLIHVHDPEISGASAARNRGVKATACDIVLFLDDDCELRSDCVEQLARAFEADSQAIGFQCRLESFGTSRLDFFTIGRLVFDHGFFNRSPIRRRNGIELRVANGVTAYRRTLFDYELLDELLPAYSFGEDVEFSKRAKRYGKIWLSADALVRHNESKVNRYSSQQILLLQWQNYLYFYDKLKADEFWPNRFWRRWWMLGQSLRWLRSGMGLPVSTPSSRVLASRDVSTQP